MQGEASKLKRDSRGRANETAVKVLADKKKTEAGEKDESKQQNEEDQIRTNIKKYPEVKAATSGSAGTLGGR